MFTENEDRMYLLLNTHSSEPYSTVVDNFMLYDASKTDWKNEESGKVTKGACLKSRVGRQWEFSNHFD